MFKWMHYVVCLYCFYYLVEVYHIHLSIILQFTAWMFFTICWFFINIIIMINIYIYFFFHCTVCIIGCIEVFVIRTSFCLLCPWLSCCVIVAHYSYNWFHNKCASHWKDVVGGWSHGGQDLKNAASIFTINAVTLYLVKLYDSDFHAAFKKKHVNKLATKACHWAEGESYSNSIKKN